MGTQYVQHGGDLTLMRLWRKSEPLENAFLIQGFEAQPSWDTPSEKKTNGRALVRARPLMRQTPGGPGVGDTVTQYYNHSLEFDDEEVFEALLNDRENCSERGPPLAGSAGIASSNFTNNSSRAGSTSSSRGSDNNNSASVPGLPPGFNFTSLLNMDSGLHVDRSFREVVWNGVGDPNVRSASSSSSALASSSADASDASDASNASDTSTTTTVTGDASSAADPPNIIAAPAGAGDVEAQAPSLAPLPSAGTATLMRVDATDSASDMNDAVNVTWEILDGGASVRVSVSDASSGDAWFGVSFPEEPCEMVPAKAIIVVGWVARPRATKT